MTIEKLDILKGRPAGPRVLVKLEEVKEKTESGIYLTTGSTKEREQVGTERAVVMKVGRTAFQAFDDGLPWCKEGDTVLIAKYSGQAHKDGDDYYRIVNDEDIYYVLKESK